MLVKVCGLNSVENIAILPLSQIDWLGFIFYDKSPRRVSIVPDDNFFLLTANHNRVGVFVNELLAKVFSTVKEFNLNTVQFHGQESVEHCAYLRNNGINVVKVISVDEATDFYEYEEYEPFVNYFLMDTKSLKHGGTGQKFNWEILQNYPLQTPFFLSGGIRPDDTELINQLKIDKCVGIDINSRFEIQPGIKDPELIKSFLESIKETKYVTD
jgi:phosphoribosylanthranilate isomerase